MSEMEDREAHGLVLDIVGSVREGLKATVIMWLAVQPFVTTIALFARISWQSSVSCMRTEYHGRLSAKTAQPFPCEMVNSDSS